MAQVIDGDTLRFVRIVNHSPERVWRAISDEQELSSWMHYRVKFEGRVGGRVYFFEQEEEGLYEIHGKVFVLDPPRELAFSFADPRMAQHLELAERDWNVRWQLAPVGGGCRITFEHRRLSGPLMWGLGEGWHRFLDQLVAYFDGDLDALWAEFASRADGDTTTLSLYRTHIGQQLRLWAKETAATAREAVKSGRRDDALTSIDCLDVANRQLHRIARQEGARPDYALDGVAPGPSSDASVTRDA